MADIKSVGAGGHEAEIHIPHHVLSPLRKVVCVLELIFCAWLIYICIGTMITHLTHVAHLLQH